MAEHLRFAVCYWHTFKNLGGDPFGVGTMVRNYNAAGDPMQVAHATLEAAFEFFTKLGVGFWCFHDRDIAPEGESLARRPTNASTRSSPRPRPCKTTPASNCCGARATASLIRGSWPGRPPTPRRHVFAYAASQIKKAMEITHELGGAGYVFWGGREGYDTLLNTDMKPRARAPGPHAPPGRGLPQDARFRDLPDVHRAQAQGADQAPVRFRRRWLATRSCSSTTSSRPPQTQYRGQPRDSGRPHFLSTSSSSAWPTIYWVRSTPIAATCCWVGTRTSSR
jgi:hypothetical protein